MTAARQQRKSWFGPALALGLAGFAVVFGPAVAEDSAQEVNPHTGLAISGFDPVAYFTDRKPRFGRAEVELDLDGTIWRFANPNNRAAFAGHPEVYRPRFGGYDPVAVARGASVPGHPLVWAVVNERLYLFYSEQARADFLADPGRVIEIATRKWPQVVRTIDR